MKRISAVFASITLAGAVAIGGASAATAIEPMPDWGPGWCFAYSYGGWYGYPCR